MNTEEQTPENKGIEAFLHFFEKNKNNVILVGIALIIAAGGIYYYNNSYKPELESEAADNFFMAERYFSLDSLDKALMGDGIHLGMIDIADEYGSTKIGEQASFYAGRIFLQQGKFEEALNYFENVSFDDEIIAAQVITLQGVCYSEMKDYKKAGELYIKAAQKRDNLLTTPYALNKAGLAFEEAGDFESAIRAYDQLILDYPQSEEAQYAPARIARNKTKQSN